MLTWQISVTLPILSQTKSWEEIYNSTSLYILPYGYNRHTLVQCSKIIRKWKSFEYLYAITFNIELDKAVVCVIRLASFLFLWFQCVCPLMPSHNTYRLTWVSRTLDVGYLFTTALAKHSHCTLPWTRSPLLTLNME